ncbi:MAG: pyridoxamine 5'-phosphate oxidase family protein [Candidatus Lokiarchaeota archaeon]|nr:pyridoxamine 5'-phosphate oxidase family protein [Candidatus Lokiarchaeota archaeon]
MELEEVIKLSEELIENSLLAYLSTIDSDGFPITRALLNTRYRERYPEFSKFYDKLEDKYVIYFSTNTSSSKIDHIKENPKVSVYFCDTEDFKGVMFGGEAEIVEDMDIKRQFWLDTSIRYYPKGLEDPDYTILRFKPKDARFYYKLNQVEFKPGID